MQSNLNVALPAVKARAAARTPFLARLRVSHKLTLAALALGVPSVGLVYLLANQQQKDINVARQEMSGDTALRVLGDLQTHIEAFSAQAHRERLAGSTNTSASAALAARVDADLKVLAGEAQGLNFTKDAEDLQSAWASFREGVGTAFPQQVASDYSDLIEEHVHEIVDVLGNSSGVILDPELASYYTGTVLINVLPDLREYIGESRLNTAWAVQNKGASDVRDELRDAVSNGRTQLEELGVALGYASDADSVLAERLKPLLNALNVSAGSYLDALNAYELSGGKSGLTAAHLNELANAVQTDAAALNKAATDQLQRLLQDRVDRTERSRLLTLGIVALVLLAAFALLALIVRQITGPLGELTGAARRLSEGQLNVTVPVRTQDEVGVVAETFNGAVARLRENEQKNEREREEAQKLQGNIGQFLDVTMDIAEGDLTRRGTVTEDVLGNVVDSINLMVEELAQVLRDVQAASSSVNQGSRSVLSTTDLVAQGAEQTTQGAREVSGQMQEVTRAIREVAQSAQDSAQAAIQALSASEQGQQAVQDTLAGMQNIRREVQGVAKRIKSLGERSLEIQEIVDTISRISSQTNLLALNAAIEAAGAGEAGSRFAIVADEVRKLADSSAQATARIAGLIKNVQAEIQEVTASVEDGTREVEQGYRVAGTAGERLRDLGELARQSATLAGRISETTGAQVGRVEQASGAMQRIAQVAEGSRASVAAGREAAEQLGQLAEQLDASLSRFRLPS